MCGQIKVLLILIASQTVLTARPKYIDIGRLGRKTGGLVIVAELYFENTFFFGESAIVTRL